MIEKCVLPPGQDALMATGPETAVYASYMTGNFCFKEYNLKTGEARDTLILETSMLVYLVGIALFSAQW